MGVDDDGSFLFQQRSGDFLNSQFLQTMSSMSTTPSSSANVYEQFFVTDWNPLILVDQDGEFNGSTGLSSYNVGIPPSQGNNGSNVGKVERIPTPLTFDNESFPESVSFSNLSQSYQIAGALGHLEIPSTSNHGIEKDLKGKKRKSLSECTTLPPHSPLDEIQREIPGVNAHEPTQIDDASGEGYIHVRTKRGQATNSHNLAERVRREKISERMRVLQDLVPGCKKITGMAAMLDEIMNYVQSLQQQVEFLSMKLAAANPELNFDIEQILSKDILYSRDGSLALLGLGSGMNTSHPLLYRHGLMQSEILMCNVPNSGEMNRTTIPQISPMLQISSVWDDKLQNVVEMGFIPSPPLGGPEFNGSIKVEL